jgi:hypothetical protein
MTLLGPSAFAKAGCNALLKNDSRALLGDALSIESESQLIHFDTGWNLKGPSWVTARYLRSTFFEYDNYVVEIMRPELRYVWNLPHPLAPRTATRGLANYMTKVFEHLDFVFKYYDVRKHWNYDFLRRLSDVGFQHLMSSVYITLRTKNEDGGPGDIVGTMRLVFSPYSQVKDLENDADALEDPYYLSMLRHFYMVGGEYEPMDLHLRSMNPIWKNIYPTTLPSISMAPMNIHNRIAYVDTPMERVLNRANLLARTRESVADSKIKFIVEPGNFAVDRAYNRDAVLVLMFHAARIARFARFGQTGGEVQKIVTYAQPETSSWHHYHGLGLDVDETPMLDEQGGVWNMLEGGPDGLTVALQKRFPALNLSEDYLQERFRYFDRQQHLSF